MSTRAWYFVLHNTMFNVSLYRKIIEDENREYAKSNAKGVLEYCILSIIRKKEAYPRYHRRDERRGLQLLEGTLYPLLNRLKNAGILSYRWVESTSGPPRKYFQLTPKGEEFYLLLQITWNELATGVETLTRSTEEE